MGFHQKLADDGEKNDLAERVLPKNVSLSGNNIIIGAYGDDNYTGSAYIFTPFFEQPEPEPEPEPEIADFNIKDSFYDISTQLVSGHIQFQAYIN